MKQKEVPAVMTATRYKVERILDGADGREESDHRCPLKRRQAGMEKVRCTGGNELLRNPMTSAQLQPL